jgi:hypothetical protein
MVAVMTTDGLVLTFLETCEACPEQYDVRNEHGDMVGYVRLRGGRFRVMCPDVYGEVVLEHTFEGDEWKGTFDSDTERAEFLKKAEHAILNWVALGRWSSALG